MRRSEGEPLGLNGSAVEKKGTVGERMMRGTAGEVDLVGFAAAANDVRRSPFAGGGARGFGDRAPDALLSDGELRADAK